MQQPKSIPRNYTEILNNINNGIYQIPKFQRDFVWSKEQTAKLVDSLLKGFPIGSFILWKTKERLKSIKKIGGIVLQEATDGEHTYYVLDGQQRLTSLYLALEGLAIGDKDYEKLYINLDVSIDSDDEICSIVESDNSITFYDLMKRRISDLSKEFDQGKVEKIEDFRDLIRDYEFSTIEIENKPMSKIADIFTRINTSGKELTLFEVVNAKVYTEDVLGINDNLVQKGFDLEEEFDNIIEELKYSSYETIGENKSIILQLISLIISKNAKREAILSLDKYDFINEWDETTECLKLAIDKVRDFFKINVSKILPYYVLLVPIAYFYRINKKVPPTINQMKQIEKYFFRSAVSWRYSSSVETKLNSDIKIFEKIQKKEDVDFDKELPLPNATKEHFESILKEEFSASNAFDKAVLCILAYAKPKKFNDNSDVRLDNSFLSISTSKNFHHFFPKAYLKDKVSPELANALANITFVDDYLNKRVIKASAPKKYIEKFMEENPDLDNTLKSHFINMKTFGVLTNEYELFLDKRAAKLADEIIKRI